MGRGAGRRKQRHRLFGHSACRAVLILLGNALLRGRNIFRQLCQSKLHKRLYWNAMGKCGQRLFQYGLFHWRACRAVLLLCRNADLHQRYDERQLYERKLHQRLHRYALGQRCQRLFEHSLFNFAGRLRAILLFRRPNAHLHQRHDERVLRLYVVQCCKLPQL
jgi:hypothetical protein